MKKFAVNKQSFIERQFSNEPYPLSKLYSEDTKADPGPNHVLPVSETKPNMIPGAIVYPLNVTESNSKRFNSLQDSHDNKDAPEQQSKANSAPNNDASITQKILKNSKRFIRKMRSEEADCNGEEIDSRSQVFSTETTTKFDQLPQISSSECLRYAIAEAISYQLIVKEKINLKADQMVVALMNSVRAIGPTNPKKYNKVRIILQDQGNQKAHTSNGTFWEV